MNKDTATELFLLQARGTMASAFSYSDVTPNAHQWEILRGQMLPTMSDLSNIADATGHHVRMAIVPNEET